MQTAGYKFTDDLITQIIEWLTYHIMQDLPIAGTYLPGKIPTERFEEESWNYAESGISRDGFFLLLDVGVIQDVEGIDLITHKASCSFSDIKNTAKLNLHKIKHTDGLEGNNYVFRTFLRVAHASSLIPSSENEYFHVDPFWKGMFEHLISHKLVRKVEEKYFWQELARPMFEENCDWYCDQHTSVSNDLLSQNEKLMIQIDDSLDDSIIRKLYKFASTNQKIAAVKLLVDTTGESLGFCKDFLENYMFPSIWGAAPKIVKPITWRWFG